MWDDSLNVKLYERLLEWKKVKNGKTAIMIEGARRVGKSTLVVEFAKHFQYVGKSLLIL